MIGATSCIFYIFYMQNSKPSKLEVAKSVFDEAGAKMISATRDTAYMQNLNVSELDSMWLNPFPMKPVPK